MVLRFVFDPVGKGCLKAACWREYLALRQRRHLATSKICTMQRFITCTHRILFGSSNQGRRVWRVGWRVVPRVKTLITPALNRHTRIQNSIHLYTIIRTWKIHKFKFRDTIQEHVSSSPWESKTSGFEIYLASASAQLVRNMPLQEALSLPEVPQFTPLIWIYNGVYIVPLQSAK